MSVDASAVAKVTGFEVNYKELRVGSALFLPQHVALIGQGATASTYTTTKRRVFSAAEVGSIYGYGSPLHLAAKELLPQNGDGLSSVPLTVFPLQDHGSGAAAVGDITPSGTLTKATSFQIRLGGVLSDKFTVPAGAISVATFITNAIAACAAIPEFPAIATNGTTKLTLTMKWKGVSGNASVGGALEVIYDTTVGLTVAMTQPTGGLNNPDIAAALAQFGTTWYTMAVNCLDQTDATALDNFLTTGTGRWNTYVGKPFVAIVGSNSTSQATASALSSTRRTDNVNVVINQPGSPVFPFRIAARTVARAALMANNNPPTDYSGLKLDTILAGAASAQWDYATRDAAVKAGCSTTDVRDDVVIISDLVTFYHPTGEDPPAYRYVVDIMKLMTCLFNFQLGFAGQEWDGAPFVPDGQVVTNPRAKRASDAVAVIHSAINGLGLAAVIADPAYAKKNTRVTPSSTNPKRMDMSVTLKLAGNTNVKDFVLNFGFYYPGS